MSPADLQRAAGLPDFPATARELIRIVGLAAAARLISAWPGVEWKVPKGVGDRGAAKFAELAAVIGSASAAQLVREMGGDVLFVPSLSAVSRQIEHGRLVAEYDALLAAGMSHRSAVFTLATTRKMATRRIEKMLKRPVTAAAPPVKNQSSPRHDAPHPQLALF